MWPLSSASFSSAVQFEKFMKFIDITSINCQQRPAQRKTKSLQKKIVRRNERLEPFVFVECIRMSRKMRNETSSVIISTRSFEHWNLIKPKMTQETSPKFLPSWTYLMNLITYQEKWKSFTNWNFLFNFKRKTFFFLPFRERKIQI